jgi:hypothetical protein
VATVERKCDRRHLRTRDTFVDGIEHYYFKDSPRFDAWIVTLEPDGSSHLDKPGDARHAVATVIDVNHDFEYVGFMDAVELANWNVVVWWTWWVVPGLKRFLQAAESAGWSDKRKRDGVGAILVSFSIAPSLAATLAVQIADAYGGVGTYPNPSTLGLADCPSFFKKLIDA